jgi:4-hydroxy-3-methylbut-2-enyl diphosphate reductase IspH
VATCAGFCSQVHHVQTAVDLRPEWLAEAETVGLTAGTSTPDDVIEAVERRLEAFAARFEPLPDAVFQDREVQTGALAGHAA